MHCIIYVIVCMLSSSAAFSSQVSFPFLHLFCLLARAMASSDVEKTADTDRKEGMKQKQYGSDQENPADADAGARAESDADAPSAHNSSASSSSTAGVNAAGVHAGLLAQPDSHMNVQIAKLKADRDALKKEKKRISNDIRNHERKRGRLRARARLLSSDDLLEVFAMRTREQKKKEAQSHEDP